MSIPALVISINALKISEQQREDAARTFIQRVSVAWTVPSEFTISNSNMTPTHVFVTIKTDGDEVGRLRYYVPGCQEVSYPRGRELVDLPEGVEEFIVFNPIDQRLWYKSPRDQNQDRPLNDQGHEARPATTVVPAPEVFKGKKLHACA